MLVLLALVLYGSIAVFRISTFLQLNLHTSVTLILYGLLITSIPTYAISEDKDDFNKIQLIKDISLDYEGAFRFRVATTGDSRMPYTNGQFAITRNGNSFYIVGHSHHQAIAQFSLPKLIKTKSVSNLNYAGNLQPFSSILKNKRRLKNPQKLDRISGMELIEGELFVNAVEFYDAPGDNNETTFIIRQPQDLSTSKIDGFFRLQDRAHAAGWMSKIPESVSKEFNGAYLLGYTNNFAINSRFSIGPSAYTSNIDAFAGLTEKKGLIPAYKLMDYSIKNPIHPDQYNKHKKNNIWTEVSYAAYGFINPNGKYYILVGNSGGHESSIGYKIKQSNGRMCGGPCAYNSGDYYNYYWIFDVQDLIKAQKKEINPNTIQPIKVGKLSLPFQPRNNVRKVIGADFDYANNRLWMLIENVDNSQSNFESAPVMLVYKMTEKSLR
jgi:hypothetical protein